MAFIFAQNSENKNENGQFIDAHLFVESLLLISRGCSFDLNFEPTLFQKVALLLSLMSESDGFKKTAEKVPEFKKFDMLRVLRKKRPDDFLF